MQKAGFLTTRLKFVCLIVLLLLNVPVNSYGHIGTVASGFVELLNNVEMNDTSSPAINNRTSKQLRLNCKGTPTYHLSCVLAVNQYTTAKSVRTLQPINFSKSQWAGGRGSQFKTAIIPN